MVIENAEYCMDIYGRYDESTYAMIFLAMVMSLAYMATLFDDEAKNRMLKSLYNALKPFLENNPRC